MVGEIVDFSAKLTVNWMKRPNLGINRFSGDMAMR
jgi:hypothetical protein